MTDAVKDFQFNVNHDATVCVTARGRDILRQSERGRYLLERLPEDGTLRMQLWCIMEIFGTDMSIGFTPPIEPTITLHGPKWVSSDLATAQ